MSTLRQIERFLRMTNMPPTRFGRLAINDPRLVHDLRNGRELRARTATRIETFLEREDLR
jgi:2,4-dienoyl-CoA reductase-like NADH-dependent reductase (Old Yellow Enzyme family)